MTKRKNYFYLVDCIFLIIAGFLLYQGSSWQYTNPKVDVAIYQCYATSFWLGQSALDQLSDVQCGFLAEKEILQSSISTLRTYHIPSPIIEIAIAQLQEGQFHSLPREYPVLSLLTFTPPLFAPGHLYQQVYAIWAILVIAGFYFIIRHFTHWWNAIIYLVFIVIAGWSTAASRFDLFPGGLTLLALICATRKKWMLAYALIALSVMMKFYPIVLLIPLLINQQQQLEGPWYNWERWKAIVIGFGVVMISILAISLAISIPGTISAFKYFTDRPLQVESFPGSIIWLGQFFGFPYTFVTGFVSSNVASPLSPAVNLGSTLLLLIGLVAIFWLQWRKKLSMELAVVSTMALLLSTGKVFSPQYMLWIIPLVAYVGTYNWRWLLPWSTIMLLTCLMYPVLYRMSSPPPEQIFLLGFIRGLVLLGFVIVIILLTFNNKTVPPSTSANISITSTVK